MAKVVVVDSDAVFALYNPNDPLNVKATRTFEQLTTKGFKLIYPSSVIFEVISLFQRVLPTPKITKKLIEIIQTEALIIHIVDEEILKESTVIFDPAGSKKNTLIDCSVAAVARKIKADGVFSYDSFYAKLGLKPAEELI
ncbi:PIN domain-containing protein [Candidatus Daviesbacteria bacterium]|nr:PIN domain-containing protein [Candidatus Daviesbacteria bacterium]